MLNTHHTQWVPENNKKNIENIEKHFLENCHAKILY